MRLMLLAAVFCVSVCLSYDHFSKPVRPEASGYDGPATFVSLLNTGDAEEGPEANWILVCRVHGQRVAFAVTDRSMCRRVEGMLSGQAVRLTYVLPARAGEETSELGPPTIRAIAASEVEGEEARPVLAMHTVGNSLGR